MVNVCAQILMGYHVQCGSHVSQAKLLRYLRESKRPLSKRCLSLISFVTTLVRGHSYSPAFVVKLLDL
ncbi:hypothetical protein BHE74_00031698 [Ensete ventricosum]|nr:hypothetical protein GW17_00026140 [Ensete ventricosum]RWW61243.1 hypothetical protein BHE74_00031698 [Ensete ventricosum]